MKILKLKFKNINSLSGENEIDFTSSIFTNDGLFAITGKTGAGKSSILDAISLALYGKTPRVEITASENHVMTRGEKDCYSEIIFEVSGKKWKSSWIQEYNSKGNLKPVKRTIADYDDKIHADQVRACDIKIIEIIGLTFEQFTKVIMLAQGSFAAFLQADKNAKGQILEQITGTEIYAEISRNVFERNRIEKDKLEKIYAELNAIKIFSDEDIKILIDEISANEKEKKQVDGELQKIEKAKKWLSDIENLQNQINDAIKKLPELEEKAKNAKENSDIFENALKAAKAEEKIQEPIFRKVRELDTKISEKEKLLQPILSSMTELDKSTKELSITHENQNLELEKSQQSLLEKENWASEHKIYEELISNYSAIENESQNLINNSIEINELKDDISELETGLEKKKIELNYATDNFIEKDKFLSAKNNELEIKKSELSEILVGKDFSEFQKEIENISNYIKEIKSLIDLENAINSNQKEIEEYIERINHFEQSNIDLSEQIKIDKLLKSNLESQINILEENIQLRKTIRSLDEHRQNLKDGEECPLCGSLEHPFALGNVPHIEDKEQELASLKKQLYETEYSILQVEKHLAKLVSDKDNAVENKGKAEKIVTINTKKQSEMISEIQRISSDFTFPKGEDRIEILLEICAHKERMLKDLKIIIEKAHNINNDIIKLRDKEIPELQEEKQNAEKLKNIAEYNQKITVHELQSLQVATLAKQEKYKALNIEYLQKLKKYSVENIQELKNCLDAWKNNNKSAEELKSQVLTLKSNIALNRKELDYKSNLFKDKQIEKQDIEKGKQKLSEDRNKLFGDKAVDEVEIQLARLIEDTETKKVNADKLKNETNIEIEKNKAIVKEKENELTKIQELKLTEKTKEELHEEFSENKIKADDLSEKIGANHQALKFNEENLKISGRKQKEKEKQDSICRKWAELNTLIGSSDGKKYRNFAQALTFEHLIGLSNQQLQKMSERYILKRSGDASNPFELYVIDNFQNGDERTAQNLSGGEKFIVSLSLALGLANMASKNMSIDTMFIDEGFGTLDSDYLDVALNALSNLQSEGKVIGIISHLNELKERIATHIEVVPNGNGHSRIQITS